MRVLTSSDLARVLTFPRCMQAMRGAMIATSARDCTLPLRQFMPVPRRAGKLGLMPGYLGAEADCFGVKIVSKYERAAGDPHGSHVGAVLLFNADTGLPLALLEGGTLTALRTASMTAVATDALARPDSRHLLIVGAGEEAWYHARALVHARPFERLSVWGRDAARAAALVARVESWFAEHGAGLARRPQVGVATDLERACGDADVICTVTSAKSPIVHGAWLRPGVHLNLVGSAIAATAEADAEAVVRSRFFVDYRDAALAAAGELLGALREGRVTEAHIAGEIGAVLDGSVTGRGSAQDITVYKSLGVTTQDLAAGLCALREAESAGIGGELELDR